MKHFQNIASGIDVAPLLAQLEAHPELWNANPWRKTRPDTAHAEMTDIWVRYNDIARLDLENPGEFNAEHVPVWYPAWNVLTELHDIVFDLMARVRGEMIGGILITKIPSGCALKPHVDTGWHVEQYDKFYLSLESGEGAVFSCEHDGYIESLSPKPGEIWLFDNRKKHWVENNSGADRVTVIICIRTQKYGRE
jgi:hypothetical protein